LVLVLSLAGLGLVSPTRAAPPASPARQTLPPILILDDEFEPQAWAVTAEATGGATYTVTQQLTGGAVSAPFRFMAHRIPPVPAGLYSLAVTHVYTGYTYDPAVQGAITSFDYSEFGRILSFPWPEAFSTTRPVVVQDGVVYSTPQFIRFIAVSGTHAWESKSLTGLTAADFSPPGGPENVHPDFSISGGPLQFGFIRLNTRSTTLPPGIPADQDLVIEQGVDHWQLIVYHEVVDPPNQPPVAVDDVFILDGYHRSLPLFELFDVAANDSDPDGDSVEVTAVTQPTFGSAGNLSAHTIVYQLDEAQAHDVFDYTLSDGVLTSAAQVEVFIDCACSVLCLNQLEPPAAARAAGVPASPAVDAIDLPLIYAVRGLMNTTPDGRRYVDMYYRSNPEILVNLMTNAALRSEALATVELWQPNLESLVHGDGSAVITQPQVDAIQAFLNNLSSASSPGLQQIITDELARLGPLDDYTGLTMAEAKVQSIGASLIHVPLVRR
jgi:hypothetical protein